MDPMGKPDALPPMAVPMPGAAPAESMDERRRRLMIQALQGGGAQGGVNYAGLGAALGQIGASALGTQNGGYKG